MMACPHHRDILLPLSCIIQVSFILKCIKKKCHWKNLIFLLLQVILLECPTALVWNQLGGGKLPSVLNGSPLDYLPCSPVILPMPQRTNNVSLRYT